MQRKRWTIAMALLFVLVVSSFTFLYAQSVADGMLVALSEINRTAGRADWPRVLVQAENALTAWHNKSTVLELFVGHVHTEAIETALAGIIASAQAEDLTGVLLEVADARVAIERLPKHELPLLENII